MTDKQKMWLDQQGGRDTRDVRYDGEGAYVPMGKVRVYVPDDEYLKNSSLIKKRGRPKKVVI